ncbi:MAG: tyrosine-protein phosphatase [Clostridiales bacterium]|nr:tyrosine-protein phosphatase [Clostridiales bacterium]
MNKNTLLTVHSLFHHSYVLTLGAVFTAPTLYYSDTPYGAKTKIIGNFQGNQMWIESPDPSKRLYFLLESDSHPPTWSGSTQVETSAISNFRDMGGYTTQQGTTVKWGTFFRSGSLHSLSEKEQLLLHGMNINHILDFRAKEEAALAPDFIPENSFYHPVPALHEQSNIARLASSTHLSSTIAKIQEEGDALISLFYDLYKEIPFHNPAYEEMFALLDTMDENGALLQHCSAGKDRTGVGSALLLLALGVDEQTVMEDYLLSSIFRKSDVFPFEKYGLTADTLPPSAEKLQRFLSGVSKELLLSTFTSIKEKYPSFDSFFLQEYGITPEKRLAWQKKYTL